MDPGSLLAIFLSYIIIFFLGFYYLSTLGLIPLGLSSIRLEKKRVLKGGTKELPAITILIPAFNESRVIVRTIRSALTQKYPAVEILVLNDGSTDATFEILSKEFNLGPESLIYHEKISTRPVLSAYRSLLFPNLRVINKVQGGKADALNTGFNLAVHDLVCILDADVVLDPYALLYLVQPMLGREGTSTAVVGGNVRILQGNLISDGKVKELKTPERFFYLFQVLEYIRSFSLFRLGWSRLNALPVISGAFGLCRKKEVIRLGGYQRLSLGEDMEFILRVHEHATRHRKPYSIIQLALPQCYTGAPADLRDLRNQRIRWHLGLLSSLRVYNHLIGRPSYKALGLISLPYLLLFEVLAPFFEIMGYGLLLGVCSAGFLSGDFLALFLLTIIGGGVLGNVGSLMAEVWFMGLFRKRIDLIRLLLAGILEPFGYHQINQWWKIQATWIFFRRIHASSTWISPGR
jgi:cellulose synthase/poly-beta-1,6-N-acetylglucosamine synthase-like glycosyltransferase